MDLPLDEIRTKITIIKFIFVEIWFSILSQLGSRPESYSQELTIRARLKNFRHPKILGNNQNKTKLNSYGIETELEPKSNVK